MRSAGIPQGGVLSFLLFSVFSFPLLILSITNKLISFYHLYPDDLQIYSKGANELIDVVNIINTDLIKICDWSKEYGPSVNPTKTQVIGDSPGLYCRINF